MDSLCIPGTHWRKDPHSDRKLREDELAAGVQGPGVTSNTLIHNLDSANEKSEAQRKETHPG